MCSTTLLSGSLDKYVLTNPISCSLPHENTCILQHCTLQAFAHMCLRTVQSVVHRQIKTHVFYNISHWKPWHTHVLTNPISCSLRHENICILQHCTLQALAHRIPQTHIGEPNWSESEIESKTQNPPQTHIGELNRPRAQTRVELRANPATHRRVT